MELVIYSPQEDQFVKAIDFNFEEIRQEMTARLAQYQGLVYTEETIRDAKTDRANLNKFRDAIEAKRKEVKKQCLAPYEAFEKKIKELTALIDAPVLAIDGQVKAFEQSKKEEKRQQIKAYYDEHIGGLSELLPLDRIFSDKWLNSSFKIKDCYDAIDLSISRATADLQTIADLNSEFELQVKDMYLRTLDLSAALNEKTRLEQQKAKMEEYAARQKEESAAMVTIEEQKIADIQPVKSAEPAIHEIVFRVWATDEQLSALGAFLKSNSIKYGRAN